MMRPKRSRINRSKKPSVEEVELAKPAANIEGNENDIDLDDELDEN